MWATIAKYLAKALVWAVQHPDTVRTVVEDAIKAKEALKK